MAKIEDDEDSSVQESNDVESSEWNSNNEDEERYP